MAKVMKIEWETKGNFLIKIRTFEEMSRNNLDETVFFAWLNIQVIANR